MNEAQAASWPDDIYRALKDHDVRQVAYVPDAGHSRLINLCDGDNEMNSVVLSTEEDGVAQLAGAWLGGQRGCLLMQSSGVGNTINMLSLPRACRMPLLMVVTMRGHYGEFNPWQVPMGQATADMLKLAGAMVFEVDEPARVGETVTAAARMAFNGPAMVAVLLSQRLIGAKSFGR